METSSHVRSRSVATLARIVTVVLVVLTVAVGAIVASNVVGAVRGGHEVAVGTELGGAHLTGVPRGVTRPDTVPVVFHVRDASAGQLGMATARDVLPLVVVLVLLVLARGLLGSVRTGDPFTAENVRRLRTMAMVLVIGFPLAQLLASGIATSLASSAHVHSRGLQVSIPGPGPIAGLGVFALAAVFAHGVQLRDDLDGTV